MTHRPRRDRRKEERLTQQVEERQRGRDTDSPAEGDRRKEDRLTQQAEERQRGRETGRKDRDRIRGRQRGRVTVSNNERGDREWQRQIDMKRGRQSEEELGRREYRGKEVERQQNIFMYRAVHIFVGETVNGLREGWRGRRINNPEGITDIQFKIRSLEVSLLPPPSATASSSL